MDGSFRSLKKKIIIIFSRCNHLRYLQAWHFFLLAAVTWHCLASPSDRQENVSNLPPTSDRRKKARHEKQEVVEYRL